MNTTHRALGTFLGLCIAAALLAGAQARLAGHVQDAAGNPLEGVSVIITTGNVKTLKITLKTDKKGAYATIIADATIPYHIRFEKEGYVPFEGDKKIAVGDVAGLDAKLTKVADAEAAARAAAPPSATELAAGSYNEGVDLMNAGNKAGAEAKFLEAAKKSPDLPAVWKALTYLSYDKKDWPKTIEYGLKATDLDPSLTDIYGMMADAAKATGDKKGAAEYLAKFAEAHPDTPEMLYNKGVESYNQKKMKDAEDALSRAIAAKPDYALAHFWLGMASINLKKNAAAKEHFQKYLELEPKGSEADTAKEMLSVLK